MSDLTIQEIHDPSHRRVDTTLQESAARACVAIREHYDTSDFADLPRCVRDAWVIGAKIRYQMNARDDEP